MADVQHATLGDALVAACREMKPPRRTKVNQGIGNKYAGLEQVLDAVKPALLRHGVMLEQKLDVLDGMPVLVTRLWMGDGQGANETVGRFPLVLDDSLFDEKERKRTNALQRQGIVISYAKRYALEAMLGLSATEDTDGDIGAREQRRAPSTAPKPRGDDPTWAVDEPAFVERLTTLGTTLGDVERACVRKGYGQPRTWPRKHRERLLADLASGEAFESLGLDPDPADMNQMI